MAKSFQEKLNKILKESNQNPDKQVLSEDQKESPTRVKPEKGEDVTHGVKDGTGKIDATGPVSSGAAGTLKTNPGNTSEGPTRHIPGNEDLPKKKYGLGEESEKGEEVSEEKDFPPFLKKKKGDKEPDNDADDKKEKKEEDLEEEKECGKDGKEANERAGFTKKAKGDGEKFNEEAEKEEEEEDKKAVKEAAEKLFKDEKVSEAFKLKTSTIFEATLSNRIKDYRKKLTEQMTETLNARVEEIRESLSEKVSGHLDLVVESWIKTHEVALESAIKSQLVEDFIIGLKNLFEESYIEIPTEKVDVVVEMANKITSLETKINEQIDTNVALANKVKLFEKTEVFNKVTKGLASTQVEKLRSLSENVEFKDRSSFETTLITLKETSFSNNTNPQVKPLAEQTLEESPEKPLVESSKHMDKLKETLARMAKN